MHMHTHAHVHVSCEMLNVQRGHDTDGRLLECGVRLCRCLNNLGPNTTRNSAVNQIYTSLPLIVCEVDQKKSFNCNEVQE